MVGYNARWYEDQPYSTGVRSLLVEGSGLRTSIHHTEIVKEWVTDTWERLEYPLSSFICVFQNFTAPDLVEVLRDQVLKVFGSRGAIQVGNEPSFVESLDQPPEHPYWNKAYQNWYSECMVRLTSGPKIRILPPAMGCYKQATWEDSLSRTYEAWGGYMQRLFSGYGNLPVCANVYPWSNNYSNADQILSMRTQVRIARDVAHAGGVPLVLTEIGRPGGKSVSQFARYYESYVWGAGYGDVYDVLPTYPAPDGSPGASETTNPR